MCVRHACVRAFARARNEQNVAPANIPTIINATMTKWGRVKGGKKRGPRYSTDRTGNTIERRVGKKEVEKRERERRRMEMGERSVIEKRVREQLCQGDG